MKIDNIEIKAKKKKYYNSIYYVTPWTMDFMKHKIRYLWIYFIHIMEMLTVLEQNLFKYNHQLF